MQPDTFEIPKVELPDLGDVELPELDFEFPDITIPFEPPEVDFPFPTPSYKGSPKKERFLRVLAKKALNISEACRAVGIGRATFYRWLKKDPRFKEAYEELREALVDFAEAQLIKKMLEGDTKAIIFFLRSKGKDRGWVERTEHLHGGSDPPLKVSRVELRRVFSHPEGRRALEVLEGLLDETNETKSTKKEEV